MKDFFKGLIITLTFGFAVIGMFVVLGIATKYALDLFNLNN